MRSLSEGLTVLNITDSAPTIPSLATVSYSNASNADDNFEILISYIDQNNA